MKKLLLLGNLLLALILSACYTSPQYITPLANLEKLDTGDNLLDSYLKELSLYENKMLIELFYELADQIELNDEMLLDEDKHSIMLHASVLEIEYRNLKLDNDLYILVRDLIYRYACSPWQSLRLNISPIKAFGTRAQDGANDVFVDAQDNIYIVGLTYGHLAQRNAGDRDAFVCKFNANGQTLWAKQFGTATADEARGVAVNSYGTIFVVGRAGSLNIPEQVHAAHSNIGAFIMALDGSGNQVWLDQFGSSMGSWGEEVAVGTNESPAVTGRNYGQNYMRSYTRHGFLTGETLFNGTRVEDITISDEGYIYVVGWDSSHSTRSGNRYTLSFVRTFNQQAQALTHDSFGVHKPYASVKAMGIRVDAQNNAYIAGLTNAEFGKRSYGGTDAFVLKFRTSNGLNWVNQFGTSRDDRALALDLHSNDQDLFVAGSTTGSLAAPNIAYRDIFLSNYSTGGSFRSNQQVGTSADEIVASVAVNSAKESVIVGTLQGNGMDSFAVQLP